MGETEMDLSNQEYDALVRGKAQPSPLWKDLAWAVGVGGGICAVGQGLLEWYQSLGLEREQAGTAVSVTLILAAALLTGLGLFDKIAKRAGRVLWCPSPALPTPWSPRRWNSKARGSSPERRPSCSWWPGRCWCSASAPAWSMA